jgi:hypothetical protein
VAEPEKPVGVAAGWSEALILVEAAQRSVVEAALAAVQQAAAALVDPRPPTSSRLRT